MARLGGRVLRRPRLLAALGRAPQDLGLHLPQTATAAPGKPIGGFTTDDLVAFVTQRGWDTPRWSTATARNYRVAMESLFGWAHHAERIPIDPAWRLAQLVRIRRTRTWQPHWLTESQIAALLREADADDLTARRDRTLLMLGLFAGLRTGELHRLCWHNIHVDAGVLEILGKGAKPASIVAAPQLRTQLEIWHATARIMPDFHSRWPVLPILVAPNGNKRNIAAREPITALSIEGIRRVVNRHGNAIGIAYLRPHDLRRTLAGILDARLVPLHDIRLVLRHDTLDATQAYLADNPLRARRHLRAFTIEL